MAHKAALGEGWSCTDDAALWARYVGKVAFTEGERGNRKITYREDIAMSESRIGEGWDIHPLVPNRALMLGGVAVEHDRGEAGHSDGDVLWHAVIDALLGAAGLGDIGTHFPPSDDRWKGARSSALAEAVVELIASKGWNIRNIDSTVILEKPRLSPWRDRIIASIASTLGVMPEVVSVKAKTMEGFGEIGRGDAVEARAVALLERA
jgi:2-C-methyl-D-erythritol 4-phosphate cytidylyltransferase/2-C-methyl-D-erythritol 2,4-cyclodiphosphate synthase